MIVCRCVTLFWAGIFAVLTALCASNSALNTTLDDDGTTLRHKNQIVFYTVGIVMPFAVVFFGIRTGPIVGDYVAEQQRLLYTKEAITSDVSG